MPGEASAQALASLQPWVEAHGIALNDTQWDQLGAYLENLLLWNRRVALVSQDDPVTIAQKHFADALFAAQRCTGAPTAVDLGSGAGFPGIVMAIVCSGMNVTLIESRRKKASFLQDTVRALRLPNVLVVADRIEAVTQRSEHAGRYLISIARALGSVPTLLGYSKTLLREGGHAVAMKGPAYSAELERLALEDLGFEAPQVHTYQLPDGSERALLIFRRTRVPATECFT